MPISKSEFESGKVLTEIEKDVIQFLELNPEKAYTMNEIMEGIHLETGYRDFWRAIASGIIMVTFPSILNNLASSGKIRVNLIRGIYYYMAK